MSGCVNISAARCQRRVSDEVFDLERLIMAHLERCTLTSLEAKIGSLQWTGDRQSLTLAGSKDEGPF
jgi:hypothetical protein